MMRASRGLGVNSPGKGRSADILVRQAVEGSRADKNVRAPPAVTEGLRIGRILTLPP